MPVAPLIIHFNPNRVIGISNKEAMYDPAKAHAARKEVTVRHNWDGATAGELFPGKILELLGDKQLAWPGGTLADHLPFQFVEGEYMKAIEGARSTRMRLHARLISSVLKSPSSSLSV